MALTHCAKGILLPANFGIPAYNFNSIVVIRFRIGFLWKRSFVEVHELKMDAVVSGMCSERSISRVGGWCHWKLPCIIASTPLACSG